MIIDFYSIACKSRTPCTKSRGFFSFEKKVCQNTRRRTSTIDASKSRTIIMAMVLINLFVMRLLAPHHIKLCHHPTMLVDMGTDLTKLSVRATTTGTETAIITISMTDAMTEIAIEAEIAIEMEIDIVETTILAKIIVHIPCRQDHPLRFLRRHLSAINFSLSPFLHI